MDAKLSKLQKWMLVRAAANPDGCLSYTEIKAEYYGLPLRRAKPEVAWQRRLFDRKLIQVARAWQFRRTQIERYAAVSNSISRAARRLVDRELFDRELVKVDPDGRPYKAELTLTSWGWLEAERLSRQERLSRRRENVKMREGGLS